MTHWRFLDYITEPPRHRPIVDWSGTLEPRPAAFFTTLVQELSVTEDWDEPEPKKRKYRELQREKHAGLTELIFKVDNRNFRPLGILRRSEREFILLGGFEKSGRQPDPANAFEEALRLKTQYESGRGTTDGHIP